MQYKQYYNRKTQRWIKVDKAKNKIVGTKKTPYKNIPRK